MKKGTGSLGSLMKTGKVKKILGAAFLSATLMFSLPHTGQAVGKGAHGPDIYVIQGMLKSLGSYSGQINGYYDDVTVRGVKHYQKKHGLPVTGNVDNRTFQSIVYSYDSVKSGKRGQGGGKGHGGGTGQGGGKGHGGGAGQGGGKGHGGGAGQGGGGKGHGGGAGQGGGMGGGAGQGGGMGGGAGQGGGMGGGAGQG
ncbi:peptidoglycan-binding domain-containing protein, partial [Brevibacillus porteri]|nr:peptidoglycan-binding domain-containing protein [Brevibacillus porteri]